MNKDFQIRFAMLRFTLEFIEDGILPYEKESALRGGIEAVLYWESSM